MGNKEIDSETLVKVLHTISEEEHQKLVDGYRKEEK